MLPPHHIGYWLSRAARAVGAAAAEVLRVRCTALGKPYVVTPPQWGVLVSLAANGAQTISSLGQVLAVETPAITALVTRLEQHGLLERVHDYDDRRVVNVSLTAEGRRLVRSLMPAMADLNARLLPAEQAPAFTAQLQGLLARASSAWHSAAYDP